MGLFLAALQDKGDIATDFKFVISYSGFYPSDVSVQVGEGELPERQKLLDNRSISVSSMHFIGKEDDRVDPQSSEYAFPFSEHA